MRRFIHKLRQKPKSTRRKIAFGVSASVTGVIFAVWLTVMIAGGGIAPTTGVGNQTQAASPLGALTNSAASALSSVREGFTDATTTTSTRATTSEAPTNRPKTPASDDAQPIKDQPYWEANDTKMQNSEQNIPPSQSGSGFWADEKRNQKDGWF